MTPTRLALAVLLALGSVGTPASAELTTPSGQLCWHDGDSVDGGPLSLVDEDDPAVLHTATLTCSVQGTSSPLHTAAAAALLGRRGHQRADRALVHRGLRQRRRLPLGGDP